VLSTISIDASAAQMQKCYPNPPTFNANLILSGRFDSKSSNKEAFSIADMAVNQTALIR
jgi:hypothetical protein